METALIVVDPETGEAIDLMTLTDRELDALHLHLNAMREEYTRLERWAWAALRQRAVANGGLDGETRRWAIERRSYQTAVPEPKRRVI